MSDKINTLLGGMDAVVTLLDGSSVTVRIRQLPVKLFPRLLEAQDDESKLVELLCDQAEGWADTLTVESFEQIVTLGEGLNSDFFSRWVRRRLERQERLIPGITEKISARCGLTLPQVCEHSLAQLKLIAAATERVAASNALLNLQTTMAGVAPCMTESGKKVYDKTQKTLSRQASGEK
jgi:hypothetical protein